MDIVKNNNIVTVRDKDLIKRTTKALQVLQPKLPEPGSKILIKPNLVEPRTKKSGAITRPEIVEGIIQFLNDKKYKILIGEGTAMPTTKLAFTIGDYLYLPKKYDVKLINLNKGPFKKINTGKDIWPEIEINQIALETDYFISAAVLKEHMYVVTLSIKNIMGCLKPKGIQANKSYIHKEYDDTIWARRLAILYQYLKPDLAIIDGTTGMYGSHVAGRLEQKDLTIVGEDPLAVDIVCAEILGHKKVFYLEGLKQNK